jgi:hypothetical protein
MFTRTDFLYLLCCNTICYPRYSRTLALFRQCSLLQLVSSIALTLVSIRGRNTRSVSSWLLGACGQVSSRRGRGISLLFRAGGQVSSGLRGWGCISLSLGAGGQVSRRTWWRCRRSCLGSASVVSNAISPSKLLGIVDSSIRIRAMTGSLMLIIPNHVLEMTRTVFPLLDRTCWIRAPVALVVQNVFRSSAPFVASRCRTLAGGSDLALASVKQVVSEVIVVLHELASIASRSVKLE